MFDLADSQLKIGSVSLRNRVLLAPMAGLTDAPMRHLAWQYGVGYTVGEMVSSKAELWNTPKSAHRRRVFADSGPRVVQIAGFDPAEMAETARRHEGDGAEVIDINFGCPAKKVCRKAAGSALMEHPELVGLIVETVAGAVDVPVTVKMRTGPHPDRRNAPLIARICEQSGAEAVTVHGRTRACRFKGEAEYDTVRAVKAAVGVPVFANGDISSRAEALAVMRETGADGIMLGRAAVGRPWLPGVLAGREAPTDSECWATVEEHLRLTFEVYGERMGSRIVRKHMQKYLAHLGCAEEIKRFNGLDSAQAQINCIAELKSRGHERGQTDHDDEACAGAGKRIR